MKRWLIAVAALVVEYLLFSVLFDAVDLVPGGLRGLGLGDIAPMPVIVGVAFFILRAAAQDSATAGPAVSSVAAVARPDVISRRDSALLAAHVALAGAFFAASFALRSAVAASDVPVVAGSVGWAVLGVSALAPLFAFALAREDLATLARRVAAPVALGVVVGIAAWSAGRFTEQLWEPLARITLRPVAALVSLYADDVVLDIARFDVGTERFWVTVAPICSGYEGMGLVAVLLGAFVWAFRKTLRFPHALVLPVIAMAAAFVANLVRIASLIAVGTFISPEVAFGGFHSKAGWLLFCAVALSIVAIARRSRLFQREIAESAAGDVDVDNPTVAYVLPLLALVAAKLVTGLTSDGGLDPLEIIALGAAALVVVVHRATLREALRGPTFVGPVVGVLVFAMWMALEPAPDDASAHIQDQLSAAPASLVVLWLVCRVLGSSLVVPLVEELAFRGFLLRRLVSADFTAVAYRNVTALSVIVSSAAFGALHDRWLAGTLAGLAYAGAAYARGRLADAVVAHCVTNALIAVVAVVGQRWSLWT